jgi:hypothetical protein
VRTLAEVRELLPVDAIPPFTDFVSLLTAYVQGEPLDDAQLMELRAWAVSINTFLHPLGDTLGPRFRPEDESELIRALAKFWVHDNKGANAVAARILDLEQFLTELSLADAHVYERVLADREARKRKAEKDKANAR